ncbi:MAG: NAD(P)H-dependent oxidoreductase [Acidobacteria bacterium]|nr:NAD(P)H-dependent oxidoreductase [Acidobacteriota bacterium]
MTYVPKILAFAGSARKDSVNKKLVAIAAHGATSAGADVTLIDLRDFPMPIYDGDLEGDQGLPENVLKLKALMKQHDGFLIASPEYNSSIAPLLKNTIDWVSRPSQGEPMLAAFTGKVAGLMSASPGGLGGLRGLVHIRMILGNIGVIVIPDQVAVPGAFGAFDENGQLTDAKQQASVERIGSAVAELLRKLKSE